jgi:hypothetical protein
LLLLPSLTSLSGLADLRERGRKEKSVVLNKSDDSYKAGLLG